MTKLLQINARYELCVYLLGTNRGMGCESSHSTPSPISSHHSSQDSLHKSNMSQPKKKGIKSSIGRFFGKKGQDKVNTTSDDIL